MIVNLAYHQWTILIQILFASHSPLSLTLPPSMFLCSLLDATVQNQNSLLVIRQIDNHSPGAVKGGKLVPSPHKNANFDTQSYDISAEEIREFLYSNIEPFLILPEGLMYRDPRPSFNIRGLDAPFPYKLLLSQAGGQENRFLVKNPRVLLALVQIFITWVIPLQMICNCYSKVFDTFNIFQYCTLKCVEAWSLSAN